jgi:hypothetical protein
MPTNDLIFSLKAETTQKEMSNTTKSFIRIFRNSVIFMITALLDFRVGKPPFYFLVLFVFYLKSKHAFLFFKGILCDEC